MAYARGLTAIDGNFPTQADLVASKAIANSLVFIDGVGYTVDTTDGGSGILLNTGLFANPTITTDPQIAINTASIATLKKRTVISGVATISEGIEYFLSANATITMPNVSAFVGGERFKVVASIAATSSTLTVDGSSGELIKTSTGGSDTVFNLTNTGVNFEFIFNKLTGNWEV